MNTIKVNTINLALLVATLFFLSAAHAEEVSTIEPITVTANKTEENVQEVPSSLTVFSGDTVDELMMEGVFNISNFTPNFTIIESGATGTNMPSMRGMFTDSHAHSVTAGLYVDGVPILDGLGYEQALIDVERIEVLRGPQGTLYGKGAEAGIINVITRTPSNEFRLPLTVEVGTDNRIKANGTISGPIIKDKFFASLSFLHDQRDGWVEDASGDPIDDIQQDYLAAKLRFTPSDAWDITLSGNYLKYDNGQLHMNLSELGAKSYGLPAPRDRVVSSSIDGYDKTAMASLALRADYLLSDTMKLSSITAYRKVTFDSFHDYDFAQAELLHFRNNIEITQLSEELRVSSVNTPIKWVAGLYADTDEFADDYETISMIPEMSASVDDAVNEGSSMSAFAHINIPFGDFSVIGGARFDYQKRTFDQPSYGIALEEDWSEISPKIGVEYRVSQETMAYATVSKGYLSGGFNNYAMEPQYRTYDAEKLWSYEIGVKNTFLDKRLILNAAVFYMDVTDAHVLEHVTAATTYTTNAAKVSSKGFELETIFRPIQGLTLNAGLGYVDATFEDFSDALGNYEGNQKPFAPEYTFNLGAIYRTPSGLYCGANIVGTGEMYTDKTNECKSDAYALVNAKVGYESEKYNVYVYGKNVFDEKYDVPYSDGFYVIYNQPAEFGVMLTYRL